MRVGVVMSAAIGAVLAVGSCVEATVTRPEPIRITTGHLAEITVGAEDLDGSFSPVADPDGIAGPVVYGHRCARAIDELEITEQVVEGSTDGTQLLVSAVAWIPGRGDVVELAFREAARGCRSAATPGATAAIRAGPLEFGPLSSEVLGILFEVEPRRGAIMETAVVVIRRGDLVSVLRLSGPRPISRALLDTATRQALGRVSELARAADP